MYTINLNLNLTWFQFKKKKTNLVSILLLHSLLVMSIMQMLNFKNFCSRCITTFLQKKRSFTYNSLSLNKRPFITGLKRKCVVCNSTLYITITWKVKIQKTLLSSIMVQLCWKSLWKCLETIKACCNELRLHKLRLWCQIEKYYGAISKLQCVTESCIYL